MTPEEKAGQLSLHGDVSRPGDSNANPQALALETDGLLKNIAAGEVSCLFNGIGVQGGTCCKASSSAKRPSYTYATGSHRAQFTRVAEPGRFEVWTAPSSTTGIPAQFTLI